MFLECVEEAGKLDAHVVEGVRLCMVVNDLGLAEIDHAQPLGGDEDVFQVDVLVVEVVVRDSTEQDVELEDWALSGLDKVLGHALSFQELHDDVLAAQFFVHYAIVEVWTHTGVGEATCELVLPLVQLHDLDHDLGYVVGKGKRGKCGKHLHWKNEDVDVVFGHLVQWDAHPVQSREQGGGGGGLF